MTTTQLFITRTLLWKLCTKVILYPRCLNICIFCNVIHRFLMPNLPNLHLINRHIKMVHGYGWIMDDISERANHTQSRILELIWNLNFMLSIQPKNTAVFLIQPKGLFTNYVDKILAFLTTYPHVLKFSMVWMLTEF